MATSALLAFNAGSGLDSRAIVESIVTADRTARSQPLTRRVESLTARISALGQLRSALTGIGTSLSTRLSTGELGVQLSSTDPTSVAASRLGGGPAGPFASAIAVNRLATGQRLVGPQLASAAAPVGTGTLSIQFGRRTPDGSDFTFSAGASAPVNITITPDNNSLSGLAQAINASGSGLVASVVTSAAAATLVIRGPEGADNAFVISAAPTSAAPGLERFNHLPGNAPMRHEEGAGDAELQVDGIAITRPSNRVDDLLPGTRLSLRRTGPAVAISGARDGDALSGALADLVGTLQAMRQLVSDFRRTGRDGEEAGALANDSTARSIDQRLTRLISTRIPQAGNLSLADLGVSVARDGSITADASRIANLPPQRLADAESLLRELSGAASPARPNRLQSIAQLATSATDGLARQRDTTTAALARIDQQSETMRATLTRQFAAMDRSVAQSRAASSQLDQLVALWTAERDR